jgi:hypothetical protein
MRRIMPGLFANALLLMVVAVAHANDQEYVCHSIAYSDGSQGTAVVTVIMSNATATTVMVTVDYYNDSQGRFLGRYEDWSNSSYFPTNEYEATAYAAAHYYDRW